MKRKKATLTFCSFVVNVIFSCAKVDNYQMTNTAKTTYSYLALGDSYTIGEGVPLYESYPYRTVQLLRNAGKLVYGPEITAKPRY